MALLLTARTESKRIRRGGSKGVIGVGLEDEAMAVRRVQYQAEIKTRWFMTLGVVMMGAKKLEEVVERREG
jgi:hypothetical protein